MLTRNSLSLKNFHRSKLYLLCLNLWLANSSIQWLGAHPGIWNMDSYYTLSQKDQGKPSNSYRLSNLDRYTRKLRFRVSLLFRKQVYIQFYSNQQSSRKTEKRYEKKKYVRKDYFSFSIFEAVQFQGEKHCYWYCFYLEYFWFLKLSILIIISFW